jgi:hypothetical protein
MENSSFDLTMWNRLESRTLSNEFGRTLKSEIRDGLWMLSRQWQVGEFEAQDTGSPVFACLDWKYAPFDKIALANNTAGNIKQISEDIPLETEVERILVQPDLGLQIEMGRHFTRMLKKRLSTTRSKSVLDKLLAINGMRFETINDSTDEAKYNNAQLLVNTKMQQYIDAAIFGKAVDGWVLYQRLSSETLSKIIGEDDATLDQIGQDFQEWFTTQYTQPENVEEDGWLPERLEYQFSASLQNESTDKKVLVAREYFQGRLDWYAMDYADQNDALHVDGLGANNDPAEKGECRHLIPAQVQFPGMPNARWWEFEDGTINFDAMDAKLNETGKMVIAEFAMLYSNDWFVVPLRVPVGAAINLAPIVVTDVFGQRTIINHYENTGQASPHWSFFRMHHQEKDINAQSDDCLLIPPVLSDYQEGKPIEEISFSRDEMANMVWGIESIVPDNLGNGKNGFEHALAIKEYYKALEGADPEPPLDNEATIKYQVSTTVPENWIPFIAVRKEGTIDDIILRRAAMPRVLQGFPIRRIRPLTQLLRSGMDDGSLPFFDICEEEVPPSGAIVKLKWQRSRWYNGKIALWQGYGKTNGRGERSSGLKFDQFVDKK